MKHKKTQPVSRIVVDEAVPRAKLREFEGIARREGLWSDEHVVIREQHPGMPDGEVLHHLLDETTLFVTTDRPMHNTVLAKGLRSWYVGDGEFTDSPLRGVRVKSDESLGLGSAEPKDSYHLPKTEIRHLLLPESERKLKKLRTKRRRIRAHFGGLDRMSEAAVTLSASRARSATLIGVRIRIAGHTTGLKALDASESYIQEPLSDDDSGLVAACHAMILLIQLMLHPLRTPIYFDRDRLGDPSRLAGRQPDPRLAGLFEALRESAAPVELIPVAKGKLLESLRRKLDSLAARRTNEIVQSEIHEILRRLEKPDPAQ